MNSSIVQILKNIPILSDIDEDDLQGVAKNVKIMEFPKDTYVFRQADKGDKFYIIKSGKVEIITQNKDEKEHSIAILYPDNFFGEMALLNEKPRNASAKCVEDTELFVFHKQDFYDILFL